MPKPAALTESVLYDFFGSYTASQNRRIFLYTLSIGGLKNSINAPARRAAFGFAAAPYAAARFAGSRGAAPRLLRSKLLGVKRYPRFLPDENQSRSRFFHGKAVVFAEKVCRVGRAENFRAFVM